MQSSKKGKCVCTQDAGIFYTKHLLFLQCVCSQGKRFQTRHHSTVPSPKRCVCLNRIKSPILSLSLSPVHSRASALFFTHMHTVSLPPSLSPFLSFSGAPAISVIPLFPSFSVYVLSLHSQIMVHVCTLQMHTMYALHNMSYMCVYMCLYACRGIEILSKSASTMWKGFLTSSRSHLYRTRSLSHLSCALSVSVHHCLPELPTFQVTKTLRAHTHAQDNPL